MSNLAPNNYAQSLSQGTIKRFSDNIIQELAEYKSSLSHIFAKNAVNMQGNEYVIRNYSVSHASTRAMENGRFRPIAPVHEFADVGGYFAHLNEFRTKADAPLTKSCKMMSIASDWEQIIDKAANLDIGIEINNLAKAGSAELIRLRDVRCALAMTSHVFASDNTYLKFNIKENVVPLSCPMITVLGVPKFISPFTSNISYEGCLETLNTNKRIGGLTRAKLLKAKSILTKHLEGRPGNLYCVLSNDQLINLLGDDKALSSDYVNHKPLTDGSLPEFCGFKIITYDYLPYIDTVGSELTSIYLDAVKNHFEAHMGKDDSGLGYTTDDAATADLKTKTDGYVDTLAILAEQKAALKLSFYAFIDHVFLRLRRHLLLDQIMDLMSRAQKCVSSDVYCFTEKAISFGKLSNMDRNQIVEDVKDHNNWHVYVEEYTAIARMSEDAIVTIKCLDTKRSGIIKLYNAARDNRLPFFDTAFQIPKTNDDVIFSVMPAIFAHNLAEWRNPAHDDNMDAQNRLSRGITKNDATLLAQRYCI